MRLMNLQNKTLNYNQANADSTGKEKVQEKAKLVLLGVTCWLGFLLVGAANSTWANATIASEQDSQHKQNKPIKNKSFKQSPQSPVSNKTNGRTGAQFRSAVQTDPLNAPRLIASPSVSIKINKNKLEPSINPTLLKAYEAYIAGDDASAEQDYKQVLQNENRHLDAMLGLAVIAQRQNRLDESFAWYKKVLALEPKNAIALSGLISAHLDDAPSLGHEKNDVGVIASVAIDSVEINRIAIESRLKSLIALQPQSANLQATLGSLYADQNQWASAQQTYFEAYRLDPNNADYSFNLAASLDQMGKAKLALTYYKQALNLLGHKHNSRIDEAVLRARIRALELRRLSTPMAHHQNIKVVI